MQLHGDFLFNHVVAVTWMQFAVTLNLKLQLHGALVLNDVFGVGLAACWPGMRVNCPPDMQVECEVGGVGGCDCLAMASCVPQVSGCFVVVDGMAIRSCGF